MCFMIKKILKCYFQGLVSSRNFILKYFYLDFYFLSLNCWLLTSLSVLFVLEFIDIEIPPPGVLKIICGTYPNQTYGFASPTGLWKVVAWVLVGCSDLLTSIYCFSWSQILFKFFVQDFFNFFTSVSLFMDPETFPGVC